MGHYPHKREPAGYECAPNSTRLKLPINNTENLLPGRPDGTSQEGTRNVTIAEAPKRY
jgi:hypothetical protein